ncbi:hypothetical protein lerEdw1_015477 [Lerista edwardsae]|nr:hypothetical protein lerEdw1_015477 [Lerista edwardsae]
MSIEIPSGLTELLQGYTVEVLRHRPQDLLDFAVEYFCRLRDARDRDTRGGVGVLGLRAKGVNFDGEPMQTESNGEEERTEANDDEEDDEDFEPPVVNRFNRRVSGLYVSCKKSQLEPSHQIQLTEVLLDLMHCHAYLSALKSQTSNGVPEITVSTNISNLDLTSHSIDA